jgi:hypothetical protein
MPRYYFQLIDQGRSYFDSEGQDLPNHEAARHEAALALSEVARDVLVKDGLLHEFEILVLDDRAKRCGEPPWILKRYPVIPRPSPVQLRSEGDITQVIEPGFSHS